VLVAKDGKVVYYKAFGDATYEDKTDFVDKEDLYDLASVTKVAATTMAAMKLCDQKKIGIDKKLGDYLPELKNTTKNDLGIREVMTHEAGLASDIWFYKKTLDKNQQRDTNYYCAEQNNNFTSRVANNMYLLKTYRDTVYRMMDKEPLQKRGKYDYSDIG